MPTVASTTASANGSAPTKKDNRSFPITVSVNCPRRVAIAIAGLVVLVAICPAPASSLRPDRGPSGLQVPGRYPETSSPQPASLYAPLPLHSTLAPQNDANETFWTYDTLTAELQRLAAERPDIVHLYDLTSMIKNRFGYTKTWQGRAVWGVRISSSPQLNDPGRPKIIVEGSHHGDEWMGFQTAMKLVEVLVNGYQQGSVHNVSGINGSSANWSTARLSWLVDNRDVWVVPMVNPDGTTYDQSVAASGGIWRKNCRDNNGDGTFDPNNDGVDLNRDYPYMWAANQKGVVSSNGVTIQNDDSVWSSSQYHGPPDNHDDDGDAKVPGAPDWWPQHRGQDWNGIDEDPLDGIDNDGDGKMDEDKDGGFSEPETCAIEALFNALDSDGDHVNRHSDISIAVSLHAYAGSVMWPWGYTHSPTAHDSLLQSIGKKAAGYNGYDAYQTVDMYPTSGDTLDWFYGSMGVLPYCIELGKSDQGGFHPPVTMMDNISVPNVEALLYMTEVSDVAKVAFDLGAPSTDIGVPIITHTPRASVEAEKKYPVSALVTNATNLKTQGLKLIYRVGGGGWNSIRMAASGDGRFAAAIPGQATGASVDYYLEAESVFNTTSDLPAYGPYDTFSYKVTGLPIPLWGGAVAAGAILVVAATVAWHIKKRRLGTSVEKRGKT